MTERGTITRTRLLEATVQVVREVGYAHATTRAIAQAAGVAEGTIYRHFPDKAAMFFAAILQRHQPIIDWMSELPARAGQGTVAANLTDCLVRLSALRDELVPLELAMLTDPELARQHPRNGAMPPPGLLPGPPEYLARYLAAEQRLGRLRDDVEPARTAIIILATLFSLGMLPSREGAAVDPELLATAIDLLTTGMLPPTN
jgi:AcrR family transcriptional regulator